MSMTPVMVYDGFYSIDLCFAHPDWLFIYGDNVARRGKGGQAVIRSCENTFGIATKWKPSMDSSSFFEDGDFPGIQRILLEDFRLLEDVSNKNLYNRLVFPIMGIGTGMARLDKTAPKVFAYLNSLIEEYLGIHCKKYFNMYLGKQAYHYFTEE